MYAQFAGYLPDGWEQIEEEKPAFVARPRYWATPFPPVLCVQVLDIIVTEEEWPRWAGERLDKDQRELVTSGDLGRIVDRQEAWLAMSHSADSNEVMVVQRYRHLPNGDVLLASGRALGRDWAKVAGALGVSLASFWVMTASSTPAVDDAIQDKAHSRQSVEGRFDA